MPLPVSLSAMEPKFTGAGNSPAHTVSPVAAFRARRSSDVLVAAGAGRGAVGVDTIQGLRAPRERDHRNAPSDTSTARTSPSDAPKTSVVSERTRGPVTFAGSGWVHSVLPHAGWSANTCFPAATNTALGVAKGAARAGVPRSLIHTRSPVPEGSGSPSSPSARPSASSPYARLLLSVATTKSPRRG